MYFIMMSVGGEQTCGMEAACILHRDLTDHGKMFRSNRSVYRTRSELSFKYEGETIWYGVAWEYMLLLTEDGLSQLKQERKKRIAEQLLKLLIL